MPSVGCFVHKSFLLGQDRFTEKTSGAGRVMGSGCSLLSLGLRSQIIWSFLLDYIKLLRKISMLELVEKFAKHCTVQTKHVWGLTRGGAPTGALLLGPRGHHVLFTTASHTDPPGSSWDSAGRLRMVHCGPMTDLSLPTQPDLPLPRCW